MELIRRKIKLFFVTYGNFLFGCIATIFIIITALKISNYLYVVTKDTNLEETSDQEIYEKKIESENISFISTFLNYCNEKRIEDAYVMLSEECKNEKYSTVQEFKEEYVNKIFEYKKEFKIEKEDNFYKIEIMEGILQSGKIDNRASIISYYRIKEGVLEKTIYIER